MEYYAVHTDDGLYHHGIKGQHWGQRRFQNEDGSVTAAGAQRYYGHSVGSAIKRGLKSNSDKATLVKYGVAGLAVKKAKQHHDSIKAKKEASRKAMEEEGRREDAQEYRHQKSGESVGSAAKRWIKGDSDSATLVKYGVAGYAIKKAREHKAANSDSEKKSNKSNIADKSVKGLSESHKKALKVGAAVAGTALAAYGAKKFKDYVDNENTKIVHNRMLRELAQAEHSFEKDVFNKGRDLNKFGVISDRAMNRENKITDAIKKTANRAYDAPFKEKVKRVYGGRDWVNY